MTKSENTYIVKATIWQRFTRHMKQWWWLYSILFICSFLIIFLPIIYVGIPHFADKYINGAQFDDTVTITNPRPTTFHISQSQKIIGGGLSGSGHLSAFNATLSASDGQEFAVLPIPEIKFRNGADLKIDQDLELSCVECLSDIGVALASNNNVSMVVKGHPNLRLGALPIAHLNIDKTMMMNGFNITEFLDNDGAFNITNVDLLSPEVDGYNFNATVSLRNPTPFKVEMGHVIFNLTMAGSSLGYVDMPNLILSQDICSTVVLGHVDESMLIREVLLDSSDGTVTIGIDGYSCHYNGQNIPYFTAAIKACSASVTVDLLKYASSLFH
ncbi:hypothetical protein N7490_006469 [Penicillium lividum]|nr:hypothetical protein N7490_006469 [Penicillium lividum]